MGDTINDMDIELEEKDNKKSFLENKIGVSDNKIIDEMNRLDLNKIHLLRMNKYFIILFDMGVCYYLYKN